MRPSGGCPGAAYLIFMFLMSIVTPPTAWSDPLKTEDFFRRPELLNAEISPSGKLLAMTVPLNGKIVLSVVSNFDNPPMQVKARLAMKDKFDIHSFFWVGNDRLLFDTQENTDELNQPVLHHDLYIVDADGKNVHSLYNDGTAYLIATLPEDPKHILVNTRGRAELLDLDSGNSSTVADSDLYDVTYFANHKNQVMVATGWKNYSATAVFQFEHDEIALKTDHLLNPWQELDSMTDDLDQERGIRGLGFSADDKVFYYLSDGDAATSGVYAVNLASGEKRLLFRDPTYDISSILVARDGRTPIGVSYGLPGNLRYFYFDPESAEAKLRAELVDLFPGEEITLQSFSDDQSKAIAFVFSKTDPYRCYLLDLASSEVRLLFKSKPWIDSKRMSPTQTLAIKARDGLPIEAFLTVPAESSGKNLPLVVLPHGGPFGIRDDADFDSESQFLAYHGYAVVRMNFRGSGGYGRAFIKSGFRKWGTQIQDDISDAAHWVVDHGIVDKDRVCIFGGSFGGYSALIGPIHDPGFYKCAFGYAGVYDLDFLQSEGTYFQKKFLRDTLGASSQDLESWSPARHADQIGVPVFLAHGTEDHTAPFEQYETMRDALIHAGHPAETLVKEKEGHGFYEIANRVDLYDHLLQFLDRNIGKSAPAAGSTTAQVPGAPTSASATAN